MDLFGITMLVGKYVFLGLLYLFLIWAFRGLFAELKGERRAAQRLRAGQRAPAAGAPLPATMLAAAAPVSPPPAPVAAEPARPAAPPHTGAVLLVQDRGQSALMAGETIELTAAVTVGRSNDNSIVIEDRFCSGHHALVFLQGGQRLLRDRSSTNGTFYNGQRITEDTVLSDGDRVGIGTVVFEYHAGTK